MLRVKVLIPKKNRKLKLESPLGFQRLLLDKKQKQGWPRKLLKLVRGTWGSAYQLRSAADAQECLLSTL